MPGGIVEPVFARGFSPPGSYAWLGSAVWHRYLRRPKRSGLCFGCHDARARIDPPRTSAVRWRNVMANMRRTVPCDPPDVKLPKHILQEVSGTGTEPGCSDECREQTSDSKSAFQGVQISSLPQTRQRKDTCDTWRGATLSPWTAPHRCRHRRHSMEEPHGRGWCSRHRSLRIAWRGQPYFVQNIGDWTKPILVWMSVMIVLHR